MTVASITMSQNGKRNNIVYYREHRGGAVLWEDSWKTQALNKSYKENILGNVPNSLQC